MLALLESGPGEEARGAARYEARRRWTSRRARARKAGAKALGTLRRSEGGREACTVVPMPRTRCGEARHREAGADGAEERETEAREGQGVLMREAEERDAEERVEQRALSTGMETARPIVV